MNLMQHARSSIRKRMILGIWIMLVPLVVFGVGSLPLSRSMMETLDRVVQTGMREIIPITELQDLILRAAMPPNDYLILGDIEERRRFSELAARLEKKFQEFVASPALMRERPLLEEAFDEWLSAREIAERILTVRNPVGNRAAAGMMTRFDERIGRAADIVGMAYNISRMKVNENFRHADAVRRQETILMISVFLGAVGIALFGGLWISRSITGPVAILQEAMERFSVGDTSLRAIR